METVSIMDRYFREISTHKLIDAGTRYALACQVRRGDKAAREKMITVNLRLAISRARFFSHHCYLSLEDLISVANIGLIKAVDGYDPEMTHVNEKTGAVEKMKFSPYAQKTIDGYILRHIQHDHAVHIELSSQDKTAKVKFFAEAFYAQHGCSPSLEEIKHHFEYDDNDMEHIAAQLDLTYVHPDRSTGNCGTTLWDQLAEGKNISPVAMIEAKQKLAHLYNIQQQIADFANTTTVTKAMLLREFYSVLSVVDPRTRPTLAELGLRVNLKHTSICHIGLRMIDNFAKQFNLKREDILYLADIIEEGKIFLEDFYRR